MSNTPLFIMQRDKLLENLDKLINLQEKTDIKILHTLKSFNAREAVETIAQKISGFSVGNIEELDMIEGLNATHIHSYSPAFEKEQVLSIAQNSDTMSLNSINQWQSYAQELSKHSSLGLRINPKLTIKQPKYCNPNYAKRMGVPQEIFLDTLQDNPQLFTDLEGLHFHVLCNQGLSSLKYLLAHINKHYEHILPKLKWLNLGGGHSFYDSSYDCSGFIKLINEFTQPYPHLTIIFEPGESIVKDTGYFLTTILDIIPSQPDIVILNTSIETHLLDIAITKQTPKVRDSTENKTPYTYQLSGMSCIAGDDIGIYSFDKPLEIGDEIIFEDMMGYTMVKQTEFNGIKKAKFLLKY